MKLKARVPEGELRIPAGAATLYGTLEIPGRARGVVVFSHGSGSGRRSPRNQYVAAQLRRAQVGTLLLDLLTLEEDQVYENRFDIDLLTVRLGHAVAWLHAHSAAQGLPVGVFGASTGAASALRVAARLPATVKAVVSRGGRPDLAGREVLAAVRAPTLLIVGGDDHGVIELNRGALAGLAGATAELKIVPGATHLFQEPGTLEEVARLASGWFTRYLA